MDNLGNSGLVDNDGEQVGTAKAVYNVNLYELCEQPFDVLTKLDKMRFWAGDRPSVYQIGGFQVVDRPEVEVRERSGYACVARAGGGAGATPNSHPRLLAPGAQGVNLEFATTTGATITLDCAAKNGTLTTYTADSALTVQITETAPDHIRNNSARRLKSLVSFPDSFRIVDERLAAERAAFHNSQSHHK